MDEATKQRLRNYRVPDEKRANMTPEEIAKIEEAMRRFADQGPNAPIHPAKWEEFDHPDLKRK